MTLMALVVAVTAGAQTGLVEFPYNPDADGDDLIGISDLLELLGLFGAEFSEEDLYVNDNENAAVFHVVGNWTYGMCSAKCSDLPSGKWRVIDLQTWSHFHNEVEQMAISGTEYLWLRDGELGTHKNTIDGDYGNKGRIVLHNTSDQITCVCEIHERPKVEYSYCRTHYDPSVFTECCNEKVADGWYPLSATTGVSGNTSSNGDAFGQAFWRWAE